MAVEKGLYQAPMGIDAEAADMDAEEFEIEILGAEEITLDGGGVEITLVPEDEGEEDEFNANLAETLDEGLLEEMAKGLIEDVESDIESRKEWADTYVAGLEVLGFKYEGRNEPWDGACGVFSTVLAEAAIRFQAETMSETFPAAGPVKTKILGEETKEKEEAALRVRADMNYELTENMTEYRPEHERMLYALGLAGSGFKKVYYDPAMGRQTAPYVPAEDVIVPYGESHIETAERVTHIMRKSKNEIKRLQASGFYRSIDLGEPTPYHTDIEKKKAEEGGHAITDDNRYALYEVHADLLIEGLEENRSEDESDDRAADDKDVDDEDIAKPYVVTIDRGTNKVLGLRRNWDEDDELMKKRQFFVHYVYVPGFGFYGLGLIHIIGGYARAGTSIIRQLVDAGTLSNLPGGIKSRGLRLKGDDTPISPGEWRDADVPGGTIRDNIMPLPYKEPSQTLLALLDKITTEGRRLGAISDMNISDMSANAPVGTTLALLERTLKPMAAVQARVHYAMKQEFKLLKRIMAEYAPEEYGYQPVRGEITARRADYEMVDVIPVSDPNSSTMAQRVVQYQAVLQMAQQAPQIYDLPMLHRQMIEVLGVKNADKLVPTSEDAKPADPVSENMNTLTGKPVKAFIYQDHDAHIGAHMAFMQDPMVAQLIGQNPQAKQIMASLQAHIAEHLAFNYRKQIEEKLGVPLPAPNEELPEEVEVQLARVVADAGKQLTQAHQQEAAQRKAQEQAQDPIIQMQQKELAIKEGEVKRKGQKDQMDGQIRQAEQQRKERADAAKAINDAKTLKLKEAGVMIDAKEANVRLKNDNQNKSDKLDLEIFKAVTTPNSKGGNK